VRYHPQGAGLQCVWAYDTDFFTTRPIAWARAYGLARAGGRDCVRGCARSRGGVLACRSDCRRSGCRGCLLGRRHREGHRRRPLRRANLALPSRQETVLRSTRSPLRLGRRWEPSTSRTSRSMIRTIETILIGVQVRVDTASMAVDARRRLC